MNYDDMHTIIGHDRNTSILLELSMELTSTMNTLYKRANFYSTTDPELMEIIENAYDVISKLRMRLYNEKDKTSKELDNMISEIENSK